MATGYYASQYFTTQLSVTGGINDSQTTDIVLQSVTGIQNTAKPGIALINYADPLNETLAEWVKYNSVNSTTKTLVGVTRGAEKGSAKSHDNGVTVAFPISESHINPLVDAVSIGGSATNILEGVLDEDDMASNSATKAPVQQSVKAYVDSGTVTMTNKTLTSPVIQGDVSGWTASTDTWTYASASTFTIAGVDRTAIYTPGTRLKFTQTSAKYAVVVSSAFSTNTTVTIAVNNDYTIANAAITAPYYSYQANPQGYPGWFAYTPTFTGWSTSPPSTARFSVNGRVCHVKITNNDGSGVSNSANSTFTVPITSANTNTTIVMGISVDNGAYTACSFQVATNSTTCTMTKGVSIGGGGWTNSGGKWVTVFLSYEI